MLDYVVYNMQYYLLNSKETRRLYQVLYQTLNYRSVILYVI